MVTVTELGALTRPLLSVTVKLNVRVVVVVVVVGRVAMKEARAVFAVARVWMGPDV